MISIPFLDYSASIKLTQVAIVLTHYYLDGHAPLRNILNLSDNERVQLINELSQNENRAFNRFKNIDWYLPQRILVEKWMYDEFIKLGGHPKTQHPMYFIMGNSEFLKTCYGDKCKLVEVNLDSINEDEISFTMSDSLAMYVSEEITNTLYMKKTMMEYIGNNPQIIKQLDKEHKYIEAQLWKESF